MSSSDVVARRVRVHGRVQGVFYRDSCRRQASSRGVAGWVSNCSDGTVEAMVAWAGRGPRHAEVANVDVDDVDPAGLTSFDVS